MILETIAHKGYSINIHNDEDPINPRTEYDNLGVMVCFHGRYDLGDKDHGYNQSDYSSWDELKDAICKDNDIAVILPIFLYDHSGITINTTGFHCVWDSGQVGFIYITKEKVREEYGVKRISPKLKAKIETYLQGEVETYDKYLRGECYGYSIDKDDKEIDSCWGYDDTDYMIEEAKNTIEAREEAA